jgi:hypothetical protein
MKKTILSLIIILSLLQMSCSSNSNSNPTDAVQGQWKLVTVSGSFAGIHDSFAPGLITWTFNAASHTVTVVNNNTNPNLQSVLPTGVYDYHFVNNPDSPCGESIDINGSVYGCYTVTNDSLIIDQAIADGYTITLIH